MAMRLDSSYERELGGPGLARASLRRPITVFVLVLALVLGAAVSLRRMPRDILPSLGTPVLYVAQPYGGMSPAQMEGFLTYYYEYHFLYVTGIEHVESKSIQGVALIKLEFHPGTDMAQALAETINYANRARAFMPPGTVPPFIMRFDAGSVPVGNLVLASPSRTVGQLQDLALNRVRPLFATLPGVSAPPPFGASARAIVVRLDPEKLRRFHVSPDRVAEAVAAANVITPAGNLRIGDRYPSIPSNSVVRDIRELENVPLRLGTSPTVFVRDVGSVADATDIPTGFALVNGKRTVYIPVTKRSDASTLSVVDSVRANMEKFRSVLPEDVSIDYEFDQSGYVRRAIRSLLTEGALGAVLAGLMILLFLGDARSSAIVALTIPLAVLAAAVGLNLAGQTINVMTLGGLALAVGILVDEATVTIENIHAHRAAGASLGQAALAATEETSMPRLLAMLAILAVFLPTFAMTGAAKALFAPLSLAVGFAMLASYLLSSTLVPVLAAATLGAAAPHAGPLDRSLAAWRSRYGCALERFIPRRRALLAGYLAGATAVLALAGSNLGREIFPAADFDQFQIRLRAPTGTAIEETERLARRSLEAIDKESGGVRVSVGFVGVQPPSFPINSIHLWTAGPEEAVFQVALLRPPADGIQAFKQRLRERLARELPDLAVSFEASDVIGRVMSQGAPAPIEVAVTGPDFAAALTFARAARERLARIQALRDVRLSPAVDYPSMAVEIDRVQAGLSGLTAAKVGSALTAATSSSRYGTPVYWADPRSGIAYQVQVELQRDKLASADRLASLPVSVNGGSVPLGRFAKIVSTTTVAEYARYNMQRMATVAANIHGQDLGRAAAQVRAALKELETQRPKGIGIALRGQVKPMEQMFDGLKNGLLLTIVALFLLLTANFQSPRLAIVVLTPVPAALGGAATVLWATGTTLNAQSFMGSIMAVGIAIANSILLVSFAERARLEGLHGAAAILDAAQGRLRPILMTSGAMIAGMLPMALGLGESGSQTAPLGRAVVGGLGAATLATLLVLPVAYAALRRDPAPRPVEQDPDTVATVG